MTEPDAERITVTKLDAARRQLRVAIELWFQDGDPVSTHTLCFAAYEVLHVVSKKSRYTGLLFDAPIKEEYKSRWGYLLKQSANFFKHANKDPNPDASIEFSPAINETFIFFAILGLEAMGEILNQSEAVFMLWLKMHRSEMLTEEAKKSLSDAIPIEHLDVIRAVPKNAFFQETLEFIRDADNGVNIPQ